MKATHKTFAATLARAAGTIRLWYFCGADEAGAADGAARVLARIGAEERVDLAGAELKRDPARLVDEARSASLFGATRVIVVTTAGDEAHDAVAARIDDAVPGWPVLVIATSATDKSRVAKLLVDRDDALVTVFHPPEAGAVRDWVRDYAGTVGLKLGDEMAARIAAAAAFDTRIARSEIDKLALYCDASPQAPRAPDARDLAAIGTETADDGLAGLVAATLGGDVARLRAEMPRLVAGDVNPVGLLLAIERRAVQLAQLSARIGTGGNIRAVLEQERVFFRDRDELAAQLSRWRGARLERLIERLAELHRAMLTDSRSAALRLQQALAEFARAAAR